MRAHDQAGKFSPYIFRGFTGSRSRHRFADDDVFKFKQVFQLLNAQQGFALIGTQRANQFRMAFQRRQYAGTDNQHAWAHAASSTHGFTRGFNIGQRIGVFSRPLFGCRQILGMAGLIGRFRLQQSSGFDFLAQLHTLGSAACGFCLLVKQRFRLFAVIHTGRQIVLFQHHRQIVRRIQSNHVRRCTDRAFSVVFDKRAFAEHRHLHAFGIGQYLRENLFGDKLGIFIADRQIG